MLKFTKRRGGNMMATIKVAVVVPEELFVWLTTVGKMSRAQAEGEIRRRISWGAQDHFDWHRPVLAADGVLEWRHCDDSIREGETAYGDDGKLAEVDAALDHVEGALANIESRQ